MQMEMTPERQKMLQKKAVFVQGLGIVLNQLSDLEVRKLTYKYDEMTNRETVEVHYTSGVIRSVDVTSDSHLAILVDLTKVLS